MFIAFDKVFTIDNILFLLKGAALSLTIAVLALMFGLFIAIIDIVFKSRIKFLSVFLISMSGLSVAHHCLFRY